MGLFRYIPFDLGKLCKSLKKKDWKEIEKQQSKMGSEAFMRRRGVDLAKSNPVVFTVKLFRSSQQMKTWKTQQPFSGLHNGSLAMKLV